MFEQRKFIFSMAEVGHHPELLSRIVYAWFNTVVNDVIARDEKKLGYTKNNVSTYGKMFSYAMLFHGNKLKDTLEYTVNLRREEIKHCLPAKRGDPYRPVWMTWPIAPAIHLRDNTFNMTAQINTVSSDYLLTLTPYKDLDDECIKYISNRNKFFSDIYEPDGEFVDNIEETIYTIDQYKKIDNRVDISLVYDIVHGTTRTIDELTELFEDESVMPTEVLESWIKLAHTIYKEHYR